MIGFFVSLPLSSAVAPPDDLLEISRNGCVAIIGGAGVVKGSGFFIAPRAVATSLDAVIDRDQDGWAMAKDISVRLIDGEIMKAKVVSLPSGSSPEPLLYNFAILKLRTTPKRDVRPAPLAPDASGALVGVGVLFSGYPFNVQGAVTNQGMISGWSPSRDVFYIQAPVTKGFSGAAVLSLQGAVLGMINTRRDGLAREMEDVNDSLESYARKGDSQTDNAPLEAVRLLVKTLEDNALTGMGVVIPIEPLKTYLTKHPEILQGE